MWNVSFILENIFRESDERKKSHSLRRYNEVISAVAIIFPPKLQTIKSIISVRKLFNESTPDIFETWPTLRASLILYLFIHSFVCLKSVCGNGPGKKT